MPTTPPAGYSGTPQARKLGLTDGSRLALDHPPADWSLTDPPPGLVPVEADDTADVVLAFVRSVDELVARLPGLVRRVFPAGHLWVVWPRRAAGHVSDVTGDAVRQHALPLGVVDTKVAALDHDWSGLKLVWRTENR